ncbi:glycoside hydrolase family 15 protein [Neorhizobium sp. NPDC001467]|uniref:glycoside hydrolase family 15 protein n=1 Tax=Neorhizobium sp. NPDC001467 TaxID=3390595 RepID=UPI003D075B25
MQRIDDEGGRTQAAEAERASRHTPDIPRPISAHGIIGNLKTTALVATDGTIDFLCWPNLDSPSVFCALLDPERGGGFELAPLIPDARPIQMYIPDTNVLLTRWLGETGSAEIVDLMPFLSQDSQIGGRLIRRLKVTRGRTKARLRLWPRSDYARNIPRIDQQDGFVFLSDENGLQLRLQTDIPLEVADGELTAQIDLKAGDQIDFVLDDLTCEEARNRRITADEITGEIKSTIREWQQWAGHSSYRGRWREAVNRSALTLKLLTSKQYGSIAAAATFGLPEAPGGSRNWDYRASWIRDASFTVYALMRLGYQEEATAFTKWVAERADISDRGRLEIMYKLDGSSQVQETDLDHLAGYGGAQPVRAGNSAATQLQLDIYGELLDSIYIANKYGEAISHRDWLGICDVVDHVCEIWQKPDAGIWEIRREDREHLHSRLMCWVAVDRAIRLAQKRSLAAPFARWIEARNAINKDIWENFWNEERQHFVKAKGTTEVDGAILMMPLVRFISATDPAWLSTLDVIGEQLADDSLVMRYKDADGLAGDEGSFATCSFWYVECLARAGRLPEARFNFEKLLMLGNHLGLYAEEFDCKGNFLGNFPQAFTHLALISAAFYLDRALDGRYGQWRA